MLSGSLSLWVCMCELVYDDVLCVCVTTSLVGRTCLNKVLLVLTTASTSLQLRHPQRSVYTASKSGHCVFISSACADCLPDKMACTGHTCCQCQQANDISGSQCSVV